MHSSRMRTARSSSRLGVSTMHPPRADTPPPGQCTPESRHHHPGSRPPRDHAHTPAVDRHMPVNILPCPKLRLRAVIKNTNTLLILFQAIMDQ